MIGGGGNPYFLEHIQQQHGLYDAGACFMAADAEPPLSDAHCQALLYTLSVLRDKVHQLQPLVGLAVAHDGGGVPVDLPSAAAIIQEIIAAASSMMYAFQHLGAPSVTVAAAQAQDDAKNGGACSTADDQASMQQWQQHQLHGHGHGDGGGGGGRYDDDHMAVMVDGDKTAAAGETIIELDAAELLAKYTHYCQVCGKGFKRDANLRMHMRAHGDEYKSSAALANPSKAGAGEEAATESRSGSKSKYSCPAEGCRWNRKHDKFQPLKSVICVKNHYKRSHCPKMYVCNRCNRKHFSVLSDLRTHEKHCGHHRWLCSCGTTFSRKDKLQGHVSLFAGHHPAVPLPLHAAARCPPPQQALRLRARPHVA